MEKKTDDNFFSNMMSIPKYLSAIFSNFIGNQTNNSSDPMSSIIELKNKISDPLAMFFIIAGWIIAYIYFAGEFLCQLVGLFYPCYYMYTLLNNKIPGKADKIKSVMKYFIIYAHSEFLSYFLRFIGFPMFIHLKIIVLAALIYMAEYRFDWMNNAYDRIIIYDRIAIAMCYSMHQKMVNEYRTVSKKIEKKKINRK